MITISNLAKAFGSQQVLQSIDLNLGSPGRITAILGPNGSGKTTLIKCILGMVLPDKGQLDVLGNPIRGKWAYRADIDYLPQIARFPENLSVGELIALVKNIRGGEARDAELLELFKLDAFKNKRLANLSGGTRQKVNLTLAFMYDSPIVILDEPTSGLDPVAMVALRQWIHQEKAAGKAILITTHIMSFVEEVADEIIFLLDGHVYFQGSPETLKQQYNEERLEQAIAGILTAPYQDNLNGQVSAQDQEHFNLDRIPKA